MNHSPCRSFLQNVLKKFLITTKRGKFSIIEKLMKGYYILGPFCNSAESQNLSVMKHFCFYKTWTVWKKLNSLSTLKETQVHPQFPPPLDNSSIFWRHKYSNSSLHKSQGEEYEKGFCGHFYLLSKPFKIISFRSFLKWSPKKVIPKVQKYY